MSWPLAVFAGTTSPNFKVVEVHMFLSVTVVAIILLRNDVVLYGKHHYPTLTYAQAQAQAVRKCYRVRFPINSQMSAYAARVDGGTI